jgi:NAD(P)-dependent dehydrogenase (short-subunit alcohol dehydrogenase family)
MNKLKDKVVIVTGGSGLIGSSILEYIRSSGGIGINAELIVSDDFERGNLNCDVTDIESVSNALNKIKQKYGKIDGFVNNAYPRTSDWGVRFEEIPIDSWKQNVDLQLNSVFICCQAVLELMKCQGYGSIVNIASIYGVVGPNFNVYENTGMTMPAAYSAIKGGVINFTRYLASYFGQFNIRINCVSPGGIFDNQNQVFVGNYSRVVPLRRMGYPEDISPAVGFLLSEESSYITGQNIIVDGGWTSI